MEFGKVSFFDSRDNKRFGFIQTDSNKSVFFHFNNGLDVEPQMPKKGDRVICDMVESSKGPKANWWIYEEKALDFSLLVNLSDCPKCGSRYGISRNPIFLREECFTCGYIPEEDCIRCSGKGTVREKEKNNDYILLGCISCNQEVVIEFA